MRKSILGIGALLAAVLIGLALHFYSSGAEANPIQAVSQRTLSQQALSENLIVTPTATAKPRPSLTPTHPAPTAKPTIIPTPTAIPTRPPPDAINGVPVSHILVMNDAVRAHVSEIYAQGHKLGRDPRAFSKVGDSTMVWPPFTALFDDPTAYTLGPQYQYLQATIDNYRGSFAHISASAKVSMHTWSEFDPEWSNNPRCRDGEAPMECELRINNPSIVLIRLGANDVWAPDEFEKQMRNIIEFWQANGVIPVVGTKPDRLEGPDNTLNKIVARLATNYHIPLWDYDLIAGTVPGKGLLYDHVHFKAYGAHDYSGDEAFRAADSLEDLTGLMMLETLGRVTGAEVRQ